MAPTAPSSADQATLDAAVDIVRQAGELTLRWFRSDDLDTEHKGDGTPVTAADKAAERFVREALADRFPDDAIVGEEEDDVEGTSGRRWIIDPIDGTKAFTRGVPTYSNLLALEDTDGVAIGVIGLPALGETVYAGRGLGCWSNGDRAQVRETDSLEGAYLTTSGFEYWAEGPMVSVHRAGLHMRTWGDAYGYALVATGRVEAMVDPTVAIWDVAPMPVILAEAGGRFTDLRGVETIEGGSGIATNGVLHDRFLDLGLA